MSWERRPGQGRYARPEVERRWRLSALPPGLSDPCRISDRYLTGTSLRLRRMEAGAVVTYKLGQKVRPDPRDPAIVLLTNLYLAEHEHELLAGLPAAVLTKTRWRRGQLVVDEFTGHLAGLVLAEVEVADLAEPVDLTGLADPREVTHDDRFSGGRLAAAGAPPL